MASLGSLIVPLTKDDVVKSILGLLSAARFPVTSWAPSSVPRALIEAFAQGLADLSTTIRNIARGGFLSLAEDDWLTLVADEFFDVQRRPAVFARGTGTLSDDAGAGPYTILPGQLWAVSKNGLRFFNTTGGTLPTGGRLTLQWQAEASGRDYNIPSFAIASLLTPLPGVSISNPEIAGLGTWLTQQGIDGESDADLRERCHQKWASLGAGGNAPAYAYHAKNASAQVARVRVLEASPKGGHVTVLVAGPAGAIVDPAVLTTVFAYLEDGRRPQCVTVHVVSASNHLVALRGDAQVHATLVDVAKKYITDLATSLTASLDIGVSVPLAELIEKIMEAPGLLNLVLRDAAGNALVPGKDDITLAPTEVATFADLLTWIPR